MTMPSFTADVSVYRSTNTYAMAARPPVAPAGRVVPAWCRTVCHGGECVTTCCNCYMGYCNCTSTRPLPY